VSTAKTGRFLEDALSFWYRPLLGQVAMLSGLAVVASVFVYAENTTLAAFTARLLEHLGMGPSGLGQGLAFAASALAAFVVVRLVRALIAFTEEALLGSLVVRSREIAESAVFARLLRRDERFFAVHAKEEVLNRMSVDINRAASIRSDVIRIGAAAAILTGNVGFFAIQDPALGAASALLCLVAMAATHLLLAPVERSDREFLSRDDQVKRGLGQFLRMAPEIQVGRLFGKVEDAVGVVQAPRRDTAERLGRYRGLIRAVAALWVAIVFFLLVAAFVAWPSARSVETGVALVPVMMWAVPNLLEASAWLVMLLLQFRMSRNSVRRLQEYEMELPPMAEGEDLAPVPPSLELNGVDYVFERGGSGVFGMSVQIGPGQLVVIAGRAGCGKSTLLKLIDGRLTPQRGRIEIAGRNLATLAGRQIANLIASMPQEALVLDVSLLENLLLPRRDVAMWTAKPDLLEPRAVELLTGLGMDRVLIEKGLTMLPLGASVDDSELSRVRAAVRRAVLGRPGIAAAAGIALSSTSSLWIAEMVLQSAIDRLRAPELLRGVLSYHAPLADAGRALLAKFRYDQASSDYLQYRQRGGNLLSEAQWRLRREFADRDRTGVIALSASARELSEAGVDVLALVGDLASDRRVIEALEERLGTAREPLSSPGINRFLTWQQNLSALFDDGVSDAERHFVESAMVQAVSGTGLHMAILKSGLDYPAGPEGQGLSGGQRKLLCVSRTLLRATAICLLDEPTTALDRATGEGVIAQLKKVAAEGRIVVAVTHDQRLIEAADLVLLIDDGRIVERGHPMELKASSQVFRDYIGAAKNG